MICLTVPNIMDDNVNDDGRMNENDEKERKRVGKYNTPIIPDKQF